jgi:hypothetical protein
MKNKMKQVRIKRCLNLGMWYKERIEEIFNVKDHNDDWYYCVDSSERYIYKNDCIEIEIKNEFEKIEKQRLIKFFRNADWNKMSLERLEELKKEFRYL